MTEELPPGTPPSPIPPSFYEPGSPKAVSRQQQATNPSGPPPPGSAGLPGGHGGPGWWRAVPGFRTATRWKQVVAVVGYLIIAAWIIQIASNPALGVFGLLSLAAVWLATDAFGLRTKLPAFGSGNRFAAGGAWAALVIAMFVSAAIAAPPPSPTNLGVGTGPVASPSPAAVAEAKSPVPTASSSAAATSPTAKPSPSPSPKPSPIATQSSPPPVAFNYCGAPANPWHYNFCASDAGQYIYNPNAAFCSYFNCIPSFWQSTNGYVAECSDGTYSHSGGVSGACSHHGGVLRPLWA